MNASIKTLPLLLCFAFWGCERSSSPKTQTPKEAQPVAPKTSTKPAAAKKPTPPDKNTARYKIKTIPGDASSDYFSLVHINDGKEVSLPVEVKNALYNSLEPQLLEPSTRFLLHDVFYEKTSELEIRIFDLDEKKHHQVLRFAPKTEVLHYGRHHWDPSTKSTRLLIWARKSGEDQAATLYVLDISQGKVSRTLNYPLNVHIRCFSRCVIQDYSFIDHKTIQYMEPPNEPDPKDPKKFYKTLIIPSK